MSASGCAPAYAYDEGSACALLVDAQGETATGERAWWEEAGVLVCEAASVLVLVTTRLLVLVLVPVVSKREKGRRARRRRPKSLT